MLSKGRQSKILLKENGAMPSPLIQWRIQILFVGFSQT